MSRHAHHPNRRHTRAERKPGARAAQSVSGVPIDAGPASGREDGAIRLEPADPVDTRVVPAPKASGEPSAESGTSAAALVEATAEAVAPADDMPPGRRDVARRSNGDSSAERTGPWVQPPSQPLEAELRTCTAPQLRRFIKSRAYVPMHELRRRFGLSGEDDDVTGVEIDRGHRVFVGLPNREGNLLGELFRAGDVGYELSLDPISPIVVGVFPMRPIARG